MPDLVPSKRSLEAELAELRRAMTPRQSAFVDYVPTELTLGAAATKAGYAPRHAKDNGSSVMRSPTVRRALEITKALAAERAAYNVDVMMGELAKGMEFALATENAQAYVRAVELRGKLTGILVDRLDARVAVGTFVVNVNGLPGGGDG